jgi:hypothetical protein
MLWLTTVGADQERDQKYNTPRRHEAVDPDRVLAEPYHEQSHSLRIYTSGSGNDRSPFDRDSYSHGDGEPWPPCLQNVNQNFQAHEVRETRVGY